MTRKDLLRPSDRIRTIILAVSSLAAVIIMAVVPLLVDSISYYESTLALALPFMALGVWELFESKSYFLLAIPIVLAAVSCLIDYRIGAVIAMVCPGSVGVCAIADLAQRMFLMRVLRAVEHCNVRPEMRVRDRLLVIAFGIPRGMDMRAITLNGNILRTDVPWRQIIRVLVPGSVMLFLLFTYIVANSGIHADLWDGLTVTSVLVMYIAAFTVPWAVIGTMDVRVDAPGMTFRLYEGFTGTMARFALAGLAALVVATVASDPGWSALWLMLGSIAFCIVIVVVTMFMYAFSGEEQFVEEAHSEWVVTHPVPMFAGLDGVDGRHPLDDGVPGTPRRPVDSCFPHMKN